MMYFMKPVALDNVAQSIMRRKREDTLTSVAMSWNITQDVFRFLCWLIKWLFSFEFVYHVVVKCSDLWRNILPSFSVTECFKWMLMWYGGRNVMVWGSLASDSYHPTFIPVYYFIIHLNQSTHPEGGGSTFLENVQSAQHKVQKPKRTPFLPLLDHINAVPSTNQLHGAECLWSK
jgi:hypothetical protein